MLKHLHLDQCDSTQDELERHLEGLDESENLLVSTLKQDKGRGAVHSWDHLPGALAFSFSTRPHPELTWQSLELAVSLQGFIQEKFSVSIQLKWPNDLYASGKNVAEFCLRAKVLACWWGIGLNLLPAQEWGRILPDPALIGGDWQREMPVDFVAWYEQQTPLSSEVIRRRWNAHSVHLNKIVTITDGEKVVIGQFTGLGKHGEAVVQTEQGEIGVYNGTLRWQDS